MAKLHASMPLPASIHAAARATAGVLPNQALAELVGPAAWRRQREGLRVKAAAEEERAKLQRAAEELQVLRQPLHNPCYGCACMLMGPSAEVKLYTCIQRGTCMSQMP